MTALKRMGFAGARVEPIREKDGVYVARVFAEDGGRYVLKAFEKPEYRREIEYYGVLNALGLETLHVIAQTGDALLMEDVEASKDLRLGTASDMDDPAVFRALGLWYRRLHERGRDFVKCRALYRETDAISAEGLDLAKARTETADNPLWPYLEARLPELRAKLDEAASALTYNDFHYTNLVVSKDKSRAFPFDYNLMGAGIAESDVANATYDASEEARAAFLSAYGEQDETGLRLHAVAEPLVTLIFASRRERFPAWGEYARARLQNGALLEEAKKLLGMPRC